MPVVCFAFPLSQLTCGTIGATKEVQMRTHILITTEGNKRVLDAGLLRFSQPRAILSVRDYGA